MVAPSFNDYSVLHADDKMDFLLEWLCDLMLLIAVLVLSVMPRRIKWEHGCVLLLGFVGYRVSWKVSRCL